jgi:ABC-type bacteriocin/lantibiotic exporter with double-glycine peptidase domain
MTDTRSAEYATRGREEALPASRRADPRRRRWWVPEVIQTSSMDCGPAALKAILEGFDIGVGYGRLREVCQTDVDGTSIDHLEEVLNALGLHAEQMLLPRDHVLLPAARVLPALVTMRVAGNNHFAVAWRKVGPLILVMDPAVGRHWVHERRFLANLYIHSHGVPAEAWRSWAASKTSIELVLARLGRLGVGANDAMDLIERAHGDASWRSFALLDAAIRQTDRLIASGALPSGGAALRTLRATIEAGRTAPELIAPPYWSVVPAASASASAEEAVALRGAVLVRVARRSGSLDSGGSLNPRAAQLAGVLSEAEHRPLRDLWRLVCASGAPGLVLLVIHVVVAAIAVAVQVALLRAAVGLPWYLSPGAPRWGGMLALLAFSLGAALLEGAAAFAGLRVGRQIELRLRVAYLRKVPRVEDRYFQSRLVSDMAERAHMLHAVRALPVLALSVLRAVATLGALALAMSWIEPRLMTLVWALVSCTLAVPLGVYPLLRQRDLRLRTFDGALSRFYLDALRGLAAIRAHGAERAVRREHEALLSEQSATAMDVARLQVLAQGALTATALGAVVLLVRRYIELNADVTGLLMLAYWALEVPAIGKDLVRSARQYPRLRNASLRVLEILGATEHRLGEETTPAPPRPAAPDGIAIRFEGVRVNSGGRTILEDLELTIPAGQHVAIVGRSGAGKSTLIGLLLGFYAPASGRITLDGRRHDESTLAELRTRTAWVDPAVQLWNRSALENLQASPAQDAAAQLAFAIDAADLRQVLEQLPEGLRTPLGEAGGLISGGEGQRMRLGRALCQRGVRLALLDEPFRGLARDKRLELLARVRELWRHQTLLCISHDVQETSHFERVLVVEGGRIIEDGTPAQLLARPGSAYAALLASERRLQEGAWHAATWRRWHLGSGRIQESP